MDVTVSYRKLPQRLTTPDELYSLVVAVAQIFRSRSYAERLAKIGASYLDLADDYFLSYLEGKTKPKKRFPVRNGRKTSPAVELTLPIDKSVAYYIVQRDILTMVTKPTTEERERVSLESLEQK